MKISQRRDTFSIKYDSLLNYYPKEDVIPMWVADMDFETPAPIRESLLNVINYGALGYNCVPKDYYQSIINWLHLQQNWTVQKEWISFIPGIVKGIGYVINYFTKPGDSIIVQPPIYPPFINLPKNNNREIVYNPLLFNGTTYKMDIDSLEKILERDKTIKVLLLSSPHNPGGIVWDKETLIKLAQVCYDNKILVVADEIHSDIMLWGNKHIPFATVSNKAKDISITFGAPSKTFNMAGVVSSFAVIPNKNIREGFYNWLTINELNSPTLFATMGAIAAYTQCNNWRLDMIKYVEENILYLNDYCNKHLNDLIIPTTPDASFLVWLNCNPLQDLLKDKNGETLADFFINKVSVALNCGESFGPGGDGFMRMNVGCSKETLINVLDKIKMEINKL